MASVQLQQTLPLSARAHSPRSAERTADATAKESISFSDTEDIENIPYHAREYARPFTYGNLPAGFKTSELNHVPTADELLMEPPNAVRTPPSVLPAASPTMLRKSTRPSISPSRPVLRKTPSRQEFEKMLMERREQAMREQNNTATKLAQNASIQKDLDELQEILNKKAVQPSTSSSKDGAMREVQAIVLSDVTDDCCQSKLSSPAIPKSITNESALQIAEPIRPETPAFPVASSCRPLNERCVSPYPMADSSVASKAQFSAMQLAESQSNTRADSSNSGKSQSKTNDRPHEVADNLVKFAKDSSEFWYKPHITREEAVALLRNVLPGSFLIRNSTTYKNAYGLVLRVAHPPRGVFVPENSGGDELVRHFLLEPTTRGVRLKGCANEPVFTSLSALVYQHSINQLALPCKLTIPDRDLIHSTSDKSDMIGAQKQLLAQGAACNVLYLYTCDTESLTGDEAIRKTIQELYAQSTLPTPIEVHFKVSQQGITLTDNRRRLFFRRHYTSQNISHMGTDPDKRFWSVTANDDGQERVVNKTIFAFVARPLTGGNDNQCHVFCDLAANQPAAAIVSFTNKVLPMDKQICKML